MVVKKKMLPVLKSCNHQHQGFCSSTQYYEANDQLSQLPDDVLFIITSFLTMKEAARTSVLSHRWNYLWQRFPVLVFEDLSAMNRIDNSENKEFRIQERLNFLKWVNRVVEAHRGRYIDELRVAFDLDKSHQSYIDKLVLFAIAKQVQHLQLNFARPILLRKNSLPKWRFSAYQPQNLSFFKSCLRSLSLKYINVTTEDIDCLLRSCMVLENLSIIDSKTLKYIRTCGLPLHLKHLEVSYCIHLELVDILTPKLLSFKHFGKPAELNIRSATMLSKVSFGDLQRGRDIVTHVFGSVSEYLPQLEYMSWMVRLFKGGLLHENSFQYNLGISNPPIMKNLKHLELVVFSLCDQSLLGWADLIEASPLLERLTLKFQNLDGNLDRKIMKRKGQPLKSLKTLELYEELGLPIDVEFVTYVVENSIMLKDVIVNLSPLEYPLSYRVKVDDQVANLRQIVPQGVNFTLKSFKRLEPNLY